MVNSLSPSSLSTQFTIQQTSIAFNAHIFNLKERQQLKHFLLTFDHQLCLYRSLLCPSDERDRMLHSTPEVGEPQIYALSQHLILASILVLSPCRKLPGENQQEKQTTHKEKQCSPCQSNGQLNPYLQVYEAAPQKPYLEIFSQSSVICDN